MTARARFQLPAATVKMKIAGRRPRGKAPAGKRWCVHNGWVDNDPPSPDGVNIDHTVVGTTPGGTLHQVVYKTLGDEAAAHEDPSKRQRRLGTERRRRLTAKRTLASCLQGGGDCGLCKQRKQDASLEEQSAQELQLEAALAVAHLPGDQAQLRRSECVIEEQRRQQWWQPKLRLKAQQEKMLAWTGQKRLRYRDAHISSTCVQCCLELK